MRTQYTKTCLQCQKPFTAIDKKQKLCSRLCADLTNRRPAPKLIGKKFGRLSVISQANRPLNCTSTQYRWWLCVCECGSGLHRVVREDTLIKGRTRSCGCISKENLRAIQPQSAKNRTVHGQADSPTYNVWLTMRRRCNDPKVPAYPNYGGRGITVCERWESFVNFYADMGERPEGMTIERVDNNKGYSPDNCVWATPQQQNLNKRTTVYVLYQGEERKLAELARESPVSRETFYLRVFHLGWSLERALTEPSQRPGKRSRL